MRGQFYLSGFASAARALRTFPARGRMAPELNDDSVRELLVKKY